MGGLCSADPQATVGALLAWLAVLSLLVGPVAALLIRVGQLKRDVDAAWNQIREHGEAINGTAVAPRKDGET
jgi:hypothetical protein